MERFLKKFWNLLTVLVEVTAQWTFLQFWWRLRPSTVLVEVTAHWAVTGGLQSLAVLLFNPLHDQKSGFDSAAAETGFQYTTPV